MTQFLSAYHVLDTQAMYRADALTIARGITSFDLMCNAAQAVVDIITQEQFQPSRTLVVCGKGNNGGDGFVVAHLLQKKGYSIDVVFAGSERGITDLVGDAKKAAEQYCDQSTASIYFLSTDTENQPENLVALFQSMTPSDLVIDALFGAGLNRSISDEVKNLVLLMNECSSPTLSIDLPSGVMGDSGLIASSGRSVNILETAVDANLTVTFFRKKPGHLLEPGKSLSGKVVVCDIGIADDVLGAENSVFVENTPSRWLEYLPRYDASSHKYSRGHVLSFSGPRHATGAARLAANAALRVGAGLVSLASPESALDINAIHITEVMQYNVSSPQMLEKVLSDSRINALVIGPGFGVGPDTVKMTLTALEANRACVIDADALTSFCKNPQQLFDAIRQSNAPVVLTPHEGEFQRLFGEFDQVAKHKRAGEAAKISGAIVVLKGGDTVRACPEGPVTVNSNAPWWLATAGSGDVLAGTIAGLLAQGGDNGYALSCAGVWIHGDAASRHGPGLIAGDIDRFYPQVLRDLLSVNRGL